MSNTPDIRFKGFAESWEQRKLYTAIDFIVDNRGKNPPYYSDKGIPVIDNYMIKNSLYPDLTSATRFIDENLYNTFIRKYNEADDILITLVGNGIGNISLFPREKAVIIQNTLGLRTSEDKKFLFFLLMAKNKDIVLLDRGMAQPSIRQDEVLDLDINLPSKNEQAKIGNFFSYLDNLITLHQRKCDEMSEIKKFMLQKMFPKNGEQFPEIRFKGFTGPWERRKFRDVFLGLQNNTLSRAELNYESGVVRNIHYGDVLIKLGDYIDVSNEELPFISDDKIIDKYRSSLLQNGDIIIADTAEDLTVGKCTEIVGSEGVNLISGLHTIPCRPIEKFAPKFMGYYMNSSSYHDQLIPLMQGIKVTSISKSALQDTDMLLPKSYDEQAKIGVYFSTLDNLISLHHCKCDELKEFKKFMLQNMFPKKG